MSEVNIRTIQPADYQEILGWMLGEGWITSTNMMEATRLWDPSGWFIAERDGQLLGCIASCVVSSDLAAGGYFIVRKDYRRQGVGKQLWEARLRYLGDRNLGIDAVENRVEPNKAKGFVHLTFEMATYIGQVKKEKLSLSSFPGVDIADWQTTDEGALVDYDARHHQAARPVFLKNFLKTEITKTLTAKKDGVLVGYGAVQPVEGGMYHVGPVFADGDDIGFTLLNHLFSLVPDDKEVTLDIPLENTISMKVVRNHDLRLDLKCIRMYNKAPVHLALGRIYAITTLGVSVI